MNRVFYFILWLATVTSQASAEGFYLYAINPSDGNLYVTCDIGSTTKNAVVVGYGWAGTKMIFSAGEQIIYGVDANNKLLWYRHDNQSSLTFGWSGGNEVASGWGDFRLIAAAGNGVIFAVHNNGSLYRYNHTGWRDGSNNWESWSPVPVGGGWNDIQKICAHQGEHLYGINSAGDLFYYRITASGIQINAKHVGTGWSGFTDVFASAGFIYGVTSQTIYKYSLNADGTIANSTTIANPNPTHTRWFGGYTSPLSYWWEGATVNFYTQSYHPDNWKTVWNYYLLAHDSG